MLNKLSKFYLTTIFTLFVLIPTALVFGQQVTPTIPLPQIVSATPWDNSVSPISTLTLSNNNNLVITPTISLPPAISATPDPANLRGKSGMSQADEALLGHAVDVSFASGFNFTLNAQIILETEDNFVALQATGNGSVSGLEDPSQLQMQTMLNVRVDVDGDSVDLLIEERIVNGIFYARGESLNDGRKTRWFGYSFSTFINDFIGGANIPGFGKEGDAQDIEALADLINFESFITTRRVDIGGSNEARFITEFDIEGLLDSPEIVKTIMQILADSEEAGTSDIEPIMEPISMFRSFIIPDVDLSFERFVNIESQTLNQAEFDFDLELNLPTGDGMLDTTPVDITLDAIFALTQFGEPNTVEIPPDALVVDHLKDLEMIDLLIPES